MVYEGMGNMAEIKVLPQEVANLIAAGEVVERPASVVKELLENSIDAGSTSITVEIRKGGIEYLRITDNGCGMPSESLETAFLRHATSKLREAENLEEIATLGFRGEALAAIAAVSKIQMTSCVSGKTFASFIQLEGGVVLDTDSKGAPQGTTILVEDLFFNTPARKKFLKTERGEGGAISSLVQVVALSHPEISMKFIRDGKVELNTQGDGLLKNTIFHVLGKDVAMGLREVTFSDLTTKVTGFISLPSCCRGSRNYQHFFVNGRYIKSPMLSAALEEAYKNQKMVGKFPAAVLHIEMDYRDVDVNVHPAKTQVKFAREQEVFQIMYHGVLKELGGYRDIQKVTTSSISTKSIQLSPSVISEKQEDIGEKCKKEGSSTTYLNFSEKQSKMPKVCSPTIRREGRLAGREVIPVAQMPEKTVKSPKIPRKFADVEADLFPKMSDLSQVIGNVDSEKGLISLDENKRIDWKKTEEEILEEQQKQETEKQEIMTKMSETALDIGEEPPWKVVGEFFRTYIAVERGDEIFFIDKHAAHERMNFNRLKAENYRPMAQSLMKPVVMSVSPTELACIQSNETLWKEFSFDLELFSESSIIIREAPHDLSVDQLEETILDLVERLLMGGVVNPDETRDEMFHTIACKAAIKAGYFTGKEELEALTQIVMEDKVRHCPHGRPITASLSQKELEKKFKRIQS